MTPAGIATIPGSGALRRTKVVESILDIFQTFPFFIYLIPAIVLGINRTIMYALFMVVIADRPINTRARKRKKVLGLE